MTEPYDRLPVAVVGAGPIGLITALGLTAYGVPVALFEEDGSLSSDTKAGTILTRTLEVLHRYGVLDDVLKASLRIDEIGDIDRATNTPSATVRTGDLVEDTRFPFLINISQHELEPILGEAFERRLPGSLHMNHRLTGFTQREDHIELHFTTPGGYAHYTAPYLLACDGGRSKIREDLGITVAGQTFEERYMLVDIEVDLDISNPRDYPYLAYFGDPDEWMIVVRQPHCWRFLYPLAAGKNAPSREEIAEKARRFIGDVSGLNVIGSNIYAVHQRVADRWQDGRIFLMGDAAHLITPMWALGLNTGVLDASNLPWRLAWVLRGWADESLLAGYEREQRPVAARGSGHMAEAARAYMARKRSGVSAMREGNWGNAFTRGLLGVRLDVDGTGDWSMVHIGDEPTAVRPGDRAPDLPLFGENGPVHLHDLVVNSFVALYFTDVRRRPAVIGPESQALSRFAVSRWDAPHDSGLRRHALFDPGGRVQRRFGVDTDTVVLIRPDAHVAAIVPFDPNGHRDIAAELYERAVGRAIPTAT
ncbi:FAD-dependent monooxygenase [Nocardia sp. 004]|uniref:FAD-dependent monooxygenase n=1 Tax=Nocardia sp. 004 TaxID=3385978 RepID=UPI0039A2A7C6